MRSAAAPGDRNGPALRLPPKVHNRGRLTRYIAPELKARNLLQLRDRCGEHGEAAVADATLSALNTWMMNGNGSAAPLSLMLFQEFERARLQLPRHSGEPWTSKLAELEPSKRAEVEAEVQRDLVEWQAANSPHLLSAIESTQRRIHSAVAEAEQRRLVDDALVQDPIEGESECA